MPPVLWQPAEDARTATRLGRVHGLLRGAHRSDVRRVRRAVALVDRRRTRAVLVGGLGFLRRARQRAVHASARRQGDAGRALVRRMLASTTPSTRCVPQPSAAATSRWSVCRRPASAPSSRGRSWSSRSAAPAPDCSDSASRQGDRVAAYLPNIPETIVAFLAACSLGATWTSCAPEFGVQAVLDRFTQVEPTVLLAVEGYRYGRHTVSRTDELAAIRAGLPSLRATVVVPYPEPSALACDVSWAGTSSSRSRGAARVRPGRARPSALRALFVGHDRACRSRSCTATAASCSSISRCSGCTPTCARPTASSGSPPPGG